jgi:glycogen(starch) synthase
MGRAVNKEFSSRNSSLVIGANSWNFDEYGGAYKIATEFAVFCAQRGWDVHYVCNHRGKTNGAPEIEFGVKVWRYQRPEGSGEGKSVQNLRAHFSRSRTIMRTILDSTADGRSVIVNGHSPLQYLGLIAGSGKSRGARKVISVHSPTAQEFIAEKQGSKLQVRDHLAIWLLRRLEGSCYRKSDQIQCDSDFTRVSLAHDFPRQTGERLVVCPGYVDFDKFNIRTMPRQHARRQLGGVWDTEELIFFSLRRHVERMGLASLIRACFLVRDKATNQGFRPFRLIIGGDGPLRKDLEKLKSDLNLDEHVYFVGRLPEEQIQLAYRAANCFVLPTSALECFGLIILESFAVGTPVIATPVGAIPEVLGPFAEESLTTGLSPDSIGKSMLEFMTREVSERREHELYEHAKIYDKNVVLQRLEGIVSER